MRFPSKTDSVIEQNEKGTEGLKFNHHHTYDTDGNQTSRTDALGQVSYATYNDRHDQLIQTNDLGNRTHTEYELVGNQTAAVDALGRRTAPKRGRRD